MCFPDLGLVLPFLSLFNWSFFLSFFLVLFGSFFCLFWPSFFPFLFLSFLSFLDFPDFSGMFPDLLGDGPGIFPICPFPLSPAYSEHLRGTVPKGSATQSGPFPKKVGNTRVWNPPGLASLNNLLPIVFLTRRGLWGGGRRTSRWRSCGPRWPRGPCETS